MSCHKVQRCFQLTSLGKWLNNNATSGMVNFEGIMHSVKHCDVRHVMTRICAVFRRTWTDAEELLKEKSFFILSFVFLSEFVIRQVQTNIY